MTCSPAPVGIQLHSLPLPPSHAGFCSQFPGLQGGAHEDVLMCKVLQGEITWALFTTPRRHPPTRCGRPAVGVLRGPGASSLLASARSRRAAKRSNIGLETRGLTQRWDEEARAGPFSSPPSLGGGAGRGSWTMGTNPRRPRSQLPQFSARTPSGSPILAARASGAPWRLCGLRTRSTDQEALS